MFGPTVLDLARHVDVSVGVMSAMLACQAVGSAIGNFGSGVVLDRGLKNYSYTYMTLALLSSTASKSTHELLSCF